MYSSDERKLYDIFPFGQSGDAASSQIDLGFLAFSTAYTIERLETGAYCSSCRAEFPSGLRAGSGALRAVG